MASVAVFAHFDPGHVVAPHTTRYLAELAGSVERVVVVSTADLPAAEIARVQGLGPGVEVLCRENQGYDFYSWKTGLDHVGDWGEADQVLLCNDSVVGPVRPLAEILAHGREHGADFWGMTRSFEIAPHVQSWFLVFEASALRTGLLQGFWRAMEPISDRYWVIRRYEVGLSRLLTTGGLRMSSYLQPTRRDAVRAQRRYDRARRLNAGRATGASPLREGAGLRARLRSSVVQPRWNPSFALWDAVFDGRLPFVKIEVLRDDPYLIGAAQALSRLEGAYPEVFAGVSEYLDRTAAETRRLRGLPAGAGAGR
ncbi:MAG: rhamnan synthesis F family protein [Kineosporiaceae bacterium]